MADIDWTGLANLLTAGGFGAIIGGIANSVIQVWGKRGTDRADIADRLTDSADKWLVRVETDNATLKGENRKLRSALALVLDLNDEVIDAICDDQPDLCSRLKQVNRQARDTLF